MTVIHVRPKLVWEAVADDGTGFDPACIDDAVAAGHVGLGSLLVRFDAMGGSIDIDS